MFRVYYFLIIANVLLSWVRIRENGVTRFIHDVTEPYLRLFRRIFPPRPSFPLDITPIFAIIVLGLIETLIFRILL